ncbi:MAG: hypothetical protein WC604_04110 [Candidatus Gracilibacteria bacterium]
MLFESARIRTGQTREDQKPTAYTVYEPGIIQDTINYKETADPPPYAIAETLRQEIAFYSALPNLGEITDQDLTNLLGGNIPAITDNRLRHAALASLSFGVEIKPEDVEKRTGTPEKGQSEQTDLTQFYFLTEETAHQLVTLRASIQRAARTIAALNNCDPQELPPTPIIGPTPRKNLTIAELISFKGISHNNLVAMTGLTVREIEAGEHLTIAGFVKHHGLTPRTATVIEDVLLGTTLPPLPPQQYSRIDRILQKARTITNIAVIGAAASLLLADTLRGQNSTIFQLSAAIKEHVQGILNAIAP